MTLRGFVYHEEDGITLYCGDAREIAPMLRCPHTTYCLEACDGRCGPMVLVTDPPYGIAWRRGVNHARQSKAHDGIQGDKDTSARDELLALFPTTPAMVFGSFYAPYPAALRQVLVWQKPADAGLVGSTTGFRRDAEPVFLVGPWPVCNVKSSGVLRTFAGQAATATETGHPHAKPVPLMERLIEMAPPGTIIDPFAGSGSTLIAAKNLGRRAIGIEIEERYCAIAKRRLAQGVLFPSSDGTSVSDVTPPPTGPHGR